MRSNSRRCAQFARNEILTQTLGDSHMRFGFLGVLSLAVSSLAQSAGASDGHYVIQKQFALGGGGGWDYLTIDSETNRFFISRSDRVLVVNNARRFTDRDDSRHSGSARHRPSHHCSERGSPATAARTQLRCSISSH